MLKHYVEFKLLSGECKVRELPERTLNGITIPEDCTCYWLFDRNGSDVKKNINVSATIYNGTIYSFEYIKSIYPGSAIVPFMQERGYSKVLKTVRGKWIPIR